MTKIAKNCELMWPNRVYLPYKDLCITLSLDWCCLILSSLPDVEHNFVIKCIYKRVFVHTFECIVCICEGTRFVDLASRVVPSNSFLIYV